MSGARPPIDLAPLFPLLSIRIHTRKHGDAVAAGRRPGATPIDRQHRECGYHPKYVSISAMELPPHMDAGVQVCVCVSVCLFPPLCRPR